MVLCSTGVILFSTEEYFVVLEYYFVVHISIGVILFFRTGILLCVEYVPKQSIPWHFEHERYPLSQVWAYVEYLSPLRTLNTNVVTGFGMCRVYVPKQSKSCLSCPPGQVGPLEPWPTWPT